MKTVQSSTQAACHILFLLIYAHLLSFFFFLEWVSINGITYCIYLHMCLLYSVSLDTDDLKQHNRTWKLKLKNKIIFSGSSTYNKTNTPQSDSTALKLHKMETDLTPGRAARVDRCPERNPQSEKTLLHILPLFYHWCVSDYSCGHVKYIHN